MANVSAQREASVTCTAALQNYGDSGGFVHRWRDKQWPMKTNYFAQQFSHFLYKRAPLRNRAKENFEGQKKTAYYCYKLNKITPSALKPAIESSLFCQGKNLSWYFIS